MALHNVKELLHFLFLQDSEYLLSKCESKVGTFLLQSSAQHRVPAEENSHLPLLLLLDLGEHLCR